MHDILKDRILRRLETLPEDRLYQVLDYLEFLESKYAQRQAPAPNVFQRFAEGIEDTLRAGNVSAGTVAEAMGLMSKAMGVLSGVAAAGASVASGVAAAGASVASDIVGPAKPKAPAGSAAGTEPSATPASPDASAPSGSEPPRGS